NTSTHKIYFTVGLCCETYHWLCCMETGIQTTCRCNSKRSQSFIEKKLNQAIFFKFQEQISRQIRKQNCQLLGNFKEIQFTQADWMQIKHLNDDLTMPNSMSKHAG
ncbi:hypothetical protein VP01_66g12, partial [Puccinia sorghi]